MVSQKANAMDTNQKDFLILVTCATIYGSIAFFFVIFCCRILLKCKSEKRNEKQGSESKSRVTSFSEVSASVCIDEEIKKPKINEGYVVKSSAEDTAGAKTFSNVDRKVGGQVWQQLTFANREDERQNLSIDKQGSHTAA